MRWALQPARVQLWLAAKPRGEASRHKSGQFKCRGSHQSFLRGHLLDHHGWWVGVSRATILVHGKATKEPRGAQRKQNPRERSNCQPIHECDKHRDTIPSCITTAIVGCVIVCEYGERGGKCFWLLHHCVNLEFISKSPITFTSGTSKNPSSKRLCFHCNRILQCQNHCVQTFRTSRLDHPFRVNHVQKTCAPEQDNPAWRWTH